MALSSLLDIVTAACDELGYAPPAALVNNADPDARQFLAVANMAGRELVRAHAWTALQVLYPFVTVAGQSDYTLPTDYSRLLDDTAWDRSTRWPLVGPITPQADRGLRESTIAQAGMRRDFRLVSGALRIWPTPAKAGDTLVLEYLSRAWVKTANGAAQTFTADTDTTVFDPDLMVKEVKWRWRTAKGFDATVAKYERDAALANLMGADLGGATLDMGGGCGSREWEVTAITNPDITLGTGSGNNIALD